MTCGQAGISGDKFSFYWLRITLVWTQAKSHIHLRPFSRRMSTVVQTDLSTPPVGTPQGTKLQTLIQSETISGEH